MSSPMNVDSLEAENVKLRARIEELERKLYPPPPKQPLGRRRYLLAFPHEEGSDPRQSAWARLQELATGWALQYARGRHPDLHLHRAYAWEEIPKGGIYTTARAALDAKRIKSDVPFYEIDKRTAAIEAVQAQTQRIREREDGLIEALPKVRDRNAHRVCAYRYHILSEAAGLSGPLDRAFQLACTPLTDYDDVVQAATRATDQALEREHQVTLESIPGYRPDGSWTCDKCGYPFEDSTTCFTCDACDEADPRSRAAHQSNIDLVASSPEYGGGAAAARLVESRRRKLENLSWMKDEGRQAGASMR